MIIFRPESRHGRASTQSPTTLGALTPTPPPPGSRGRLRREAGGRLRPGRPWPSSRPSLCAANPPWQQPRSATAPSSRSPPKRGRTCGGRAPLSARRAVHGSLSRSRGAQASTRATNHVAAGGTRRATQYYNFVHARSHLRIRRTRACFRAAAAGKGPSVERSTLTTVRHLPKTCRGPPRGRGPPGIEAAALLDRSRGELVARKEGLLESQCRWRPRRWPRSPTPLHDPRCRALVLALVLAPVALFFALSEGVTFEGRFSSPGGQNRTRIASLWSPTPIRDLRYRGPARSSLLLCKCLLK